MTIKYTQFDHDTFLRACADSRATDEERRFLSYQASRWALNAPVNKTDYLRAQALTGGALCTITPIFQRKAKALPVPAGSQKG